MFFFLVFGPAQSQKGKFPGSKALPPGSHPILCLPPRWNTSRRRVRGNELVEKSFNSRDQVGARNNFIHQADAISFARIDDFD